MSKVKLFQHFTDLNSNKYDTHEFHGISTEITIFRRNHLVDVCILDLGTESLESFVIF